MKRLTSLILAVLLTMYCAIITSCHSAGALIDREAVVERHQVHVTSLDPQSALTVGNGDFAFTVGITGLQCFDSLYHAQGIPTETLSSWSWHTFPNTEGYKFEDTMKPYDFHGKELLFATAEKTPVGQYFRINPHPTALGQISLMYDGRELRPEDITAIDQHLDLWTGIITSKYAVRGVPVEVTTLSHPTRSAVGISLTSALVKDGRLTVRFHFPYAYAAQHKNKPPLIWNRPDAHTTTAIRQENGFALLRRQTDGTIYHTAISWNDGFALTEAAGHDFRLTQGTSAGTTLSFTCEFLPEGQAAEPIAYEQTRLASVEGWKSFWTKGGMVDLSESTDPRATELERRIIQSLYLLKVNYSGHFPPSECGLVTPTWYGKHNSEVYLIHSAQFYQWGHVELLENGLSWYKKILPLAQADAASKGWQGARWPKMAGIDGRPTPGGINPFIIWNFPNPAYLCELVYRAKPTKETLESYKDIVLETGAFLASYATYHPESDRYVLGPPLKASSEGQSERDTWNPTFELALWWYGLHVAQTWRVRLGLGEDSHWADVLDKLSKPTVADGKYVEIETEPHIYDSPRGMPTSMLYAFGYVPKTPLIDVDIMKATFDEKMRRSHKDSWVSWAMGQVANTATRLGEAEIAVDIVCNDAPKARFLPQGYVPRAKEPDGCPAYMPVNGSFLNAVGLMIGGWDGAPDTAAPGFPTNGKWVVKAEGLMKMP